MRHGSGSGRVEEQGSAVVEFALVLPLILALVLGLVEVALVARSQLMVLNAAREGAREAAVSPDPKAAADAAKAVLGAQGTAARISVRHPHVVGQPAQVQVELPHRVAAPIFGGFEIDLSARASMRIER